MNPMEAKAKNYSKSYNPSQNRPWEAKKASVKQLEKPNDALFAEVERALELSPRKAKRGPKARSGNNSRVTAWYGRNSSKLGIDSTSDFRQSGNAVKICVENDLGDPAAMVGFFDYGLSGADKNRPELNRLKAFLTAHPGCNLVIEDVDRPVRDEAVLLVIGAVIVENDIRVFDLDGLVTESDLIKKGQAASDVRRMIRNRSLQTRHTILSDGAICIKAPLGYNKTPSDLEKDERVAPLIQEMFDKKLAGESVAGLVRWLQNEQHVFPANSSVWDWQTIRDALSNEIYVGLLRSELEGKIYEFQREDLRLVTTSTWLAVQQKLREEKEARERRKRAKAENGASPRIKPGATRMLIHACICPECQSGMKHDSAGKSREEKMLLCRRAGFGLCKAREKFTYVEVEQAVLTDLGRLLSQPDLEALFREEDQKTQSDAEVRIAERISELQSLIDAKQLKIKQTWEHADKITPKLVDLINEQQRQVSEWENDRIELRSKQLRGIDDTELPTIAAEIADIVMSGPYTPTNSLDRQIFASIARIVRRIELKRTDGTHAVADVTLDFSVELGRQPGTIVFERSVAFATKPTRWDWNEKETIESAVRTREFHLTDAEVDTLAACPEVAETIGGLPQATLRTCLDALAICIGLDVNHSLVLPALGLVNTKKIRNALHRLRHHDSRVHFVDVFHGLRPNAPGMNRLVSLGRPTRSARWQMEKAGNPILLHPLAMRDGEDRDMTDTEWKIAYAAMTADENRKRKRFPPVIRRNLNDLFSVLRKGTTISSRVPLSRRNSFYAWFKFVRETDELEAIARALLELEGIPLPG